MFAFFENVRNGHDDVMLPPAPIMEWLGEVGGVRFSASAGGPSPPWPIRAFSAYEARSGPLGAKLHGREKARGLWGSPTARAGNLVINHPNHRKSHTESSESS